MDIIQNLRWKTLKNISFPYKILLRIVDKKYKIKVKENNIEDFLKNIEKYQEINISELLFNIEEYAFKKLMMFSLKDREAEEITNYILKEEFINRNMLKFIKDKENLAGIGEDMKCVHFSEKGKYIIIKMAQVKKIEEETTDVEYTRIIEEEYYDFVKFVIDTSEEIVFMFYNDTSAIIKFDIGNKKEITYKKSCFYNLFSKGNQLSLGKYSIDDELNKYVMDALDKFHDEDEECLTSKDITIIETEDPIESRNNLRSSRKDSRHNKYRLWAIKYALKNEDHNVKMIECKINNRTIILKNTGEIMLQLPFFGMEVIKDVCEEIFPQYPLLSKSIKSTGTDNN